MLDVLTLRPIKARSWFYIFRKQIFCNPIRWALSLEYSTQNRTMAFDRHMTQCVQVARMTCLFFCSWWHNRNLEFSRMCTQTGRLLLFFFRASYGVIISGLDSLGLVSLTSEALLWAMTWLAVHKMRSQLSEQIRTSDGTMHSGFESRKNVPRNDE